MGRRSGVGPFFLYAIGELTNGQLCHRVDEVRRDLAERIEHEPSLAKARMGHLQIHVIHDFLTSQDQIEVERSRRAGIGAGPAGRTLDGAQRLEDFADGPVGESHARGVQVRRIVFEARADRRSFNDR